MTASVEVSSLTLNRLSVYLRCLRRLEEGGEKRISSHELARRFHLSASQIRKDLAQFGEFGIRGVGYDVASLAERLTVLLGLGSEHLIVVVGMGNLGSALVRFPGFNEGPFRVVAGVDTDRSKVGRKVGGIQIRDARELAGIVAETGAEIGVLSVPSESAQENYEALVAAGIRSVLNFAPVRLELDPRVPAKSVDLRIHLEELTYALRDGSAAGGGPKTPPVRKRTNS